MATTAYALFNFLLTALDTIIVTRNIRCGQQMYWFSITSDKRNHLFS